MQEAELRNMANIQLPDGNKVINEAEIERHMFYMDEKGIIVNYLLTPPNMTNSKAEMINLIYTLS
jgi:hypothetical protein